MANSSKVTHADDRIPAERVSTNTPGAIVDTTPTLGNTNNAAEYARAGANEFKAKLLAKAMVLTNTYAPKTLWTRRMKWGNTTYDVCVELHGGVCVYDPNTGDELTTGPLGYPITQE